jgi:hypothetical protein
MQTLNKLFIFAVSSSLFYDTPHSNLCQLQHSSDEDDENEPEPSRKKRAGGGLLMDLEMVGGGEIPEPTSAAARRWFGGSNNDLFQEAEEEAAASMATSLMDKDLDEDSEGGEDDGQDDDEDLEFEDDSYVADAVEKHGKAKMEADAAVKTNTGATVTNDKTSKKDEGVKTDKIKSEAPKVTVPPPARQFLPSKKFKGAKEGYMFTTRYLSSAVDWILCCCVIPSCVTLGCNELNSWNLINLRSFCSEKTVKSLPSVCRHMSNLPRIGMICESDLIFPPAAHLLCVLSSFDTYALGIKKLDTTWRKKNQ